MKKKSLFTKLICTCVVTSLFIMPTSAGASTNDNTIKAEQQKAYSSKEYSDTIKAEQQKVYSSKDYIDKAWAKAKAKPVTPDKVDPNASTNSLVTASSTASYGSYPTRNGVILVTADFYKGLIPTGHAGIVWWGSNNKIIESLSNGVVIGANDWNIKKNTCYGVTVIGTTSTEDNDASNWCWSKVGLPYNMNYLNPWSTSSYYCSQLVWQSFLEKGYNLDTSLFGFAVHPMELVASGNTRTVYTK